jgi:esterase/lipase
VAFPVLVVQAEQEDVTGPMNAQFIIEHVGSSRRELLLLKQSYHLVSADLERSTVADHLQKFCGSIALPRSESPNAERAHAKIAA